MIIFTKHTLIRMKERKISKKEIKDTIANPKFLKRDSHKIIANKKNIEVVFIKENSKIIIITCYRI